MIHVRQNGSLDKIDKRWGYLVKKSAVFRTPDLPAFVFGKLEWVQKKRSLIWKLLTCC